MFFKLSVAADAGEIGLEVIARACLASVRAIRRVLHVRVVTYARGSPGVYIETFPSRQPMLADFLRAPRYELEGLTVAFVAIVFNAAILEDLLLVELEQVAAEAFRVRADAEALVLCRAIALPGDVDTALHRFVSMVELPGQHLSSTWCHSNLLD